MTLSSRKVQNKTGKTMVVERSKSSSASVISKHELSQMNKNMEHNQCYLSDAFRK